jgi:hypothetical protein
MARSRSPTRGASRDKAKDLLKEGKDPSTEKAAGPAFRLDNWLHRADKRIRLSDRNREVRFGNTVIQPSESVGGA